MTMMQRASEFPYEYRRVCMTRIVSFKRFRAHEKKKSRRIVLPFSLLDSQTDRVFWRTNSPNLSQGCEPQDQSLLSCIPRLFVAELSSSGATNRDRANAGNHHQCVIDHHDHADDRNRVYHDCHVAVTFHRSARHSSKRAAVERSLDRARVSLPRIPCFPHPRSPFRSISFRFISFRFVSAISLARWL